MYTAIKWIKNKRNYCFLLGEKTELLTMKKKRKKKEQQIM